MFVDWNMKEKKMNCFCKKEKCVCIYTADEIAELEHLAIEYINEIQNRFPYTETYREYSHLSGDYRTFDEAAIDLILLPIGDTSGAYSDFFWRDHEMITPNQLALKNTSSGRRRSISSVNKYMTIYNHINAVRNIVELVLKVKRILPVNELYYPNPMAMYQLNNKDWNYYKCFWMLDDVKKMNEVLFECD